MWNDRLRIAESVQADWTSLSAEDRETIRGVLQKIDDDPIAGAPLFEPLKGLWSYRADDLRVVYRVVAEGRFVAILSIGKVSR